MWSGSGNLNSEPQSPKVTVAVEDGKQVVNFPIDALVVNTQFSEADTKVVQADRTFTQGLESVTGLAGAAAKLGCNVFTFGQLQRGCSNTFDFNAWANDNQAEVDQLLRFKTLEEVQKTCGPQQWKKESALIIKSFQDEGVKKGWKAADTTVNFVDKTGKVTTATPDYTRNVLDGLKKKGILLKAPAGFEVQPVFSNVKCSEAKSQTKPDATSTTPSGAAGN
jgi:hypothetical protein